MLPHSILVHGPSGPLRGIHLSTQMVTSLNYSPDPHGLPIFGVLSYENTGFTFKVSTVKCQTQGTQGCISYQNASELLLKHHLGLALLLSEARDVIVFRA